MDTNSKTSMYNSSAYGQQQAAKQAVFNNSKYGKMQATLAANEAESKETKKYTLANGKVLVRPASSGKYINFKALFGSIGSSDDTDSSNASTLALFDSMKSTSSNIMSYYEAQAKQRLGLS